LKKLIPLVAMTSVEGWTEKAEWYVADSSFFETATTIPLSLYSRPSFIKNSVAIRDSLNRTKSGGSIISSTVQVQGEFRQRGKFFRNYRGSE
jgi:hypothetical protein